ncbi:MAG: DUF4255 domain-containing protein [Holophagaceae bacterium]
MASHRAIMGVLLALKERLSQRLAVSLGGNPKVVILGSKDLMSPPSTETLGIYLHRLAVDPFGRNRYLPVPEGRHLPSPELPLNLHILLVGWSTSSEAEITYLSAAMQILGGALVLDASHLSLSDPTWGDSDSVQVIPDDMSTEDLMRLWDSMPGDYYLSSPYIIKTVRLSPDQEPPEGPLVKTQVFKLDGGPS